jgi:hypothetical protein
MHSTTPLPGVAAVQSRLAGSLQVSERELSPRSFVLPISAVDAASLPPSKAATQFWPFKTEKKSDQ